MCKVTRVAMGFRSPHRKVAFLALRRTGATRWQTRFRRLRRY
jgi:hypothetical protein